MGLQSDVAGCTGACADGTKSDSSNSSNSNPSAPTGGSSNEGVGNIGVGGANPQTSNNLYPAHGKYFYDAPVNNNDAPPAYYSAPMVGAPDMKGIMCRRNLLEPQPPLRSNIEGSDLNYDKAYRKAFSEYLGNYFKYQIESGKIKIRVIPIDNPIRTEMPKKDGVAIPGGDRGFNEYSPFSWE